MIVNAAATFVFSVLTFNTIYRYILQPNEHLRDLLYVQLKWESFYLFTTLMVIHICDLVTSEVSIVSDTSFKSLE